MVREIETDIDGKRWIITYEYVPAEGDGWNEPHFQETVLIISVVDDEGNDIVFSHEQEQELIEICLNSFRDAIESCLADYIYRNKIDGGIK